MKRIKKVYKKQRGRTAPDTVNSWANHEVELACKHEAPDWDGESFDYGIACYKSALKAYNSLAADGHSGFSWLMTRQILNRLMNNQPLTPITDDDFTINDKGICNCQPIEYLDERNLKSEIQCPRMSSLFRTEHNNGTITYSDVDRYYCFNINNPDDTYSGGGACRIIDELFPITMPYMPPSGKYKLACEEFLVDNTMSDYDTKAYHYVITPGGERIELNRFYKEITDGEPVTETIEIQRYVPFGDPDDDGMVALQPVTESKTSTYQPTKWVEISKEEFEERKRNKIDITDTKETT